MKLRNLKIGTQFLLGSGLMFLLVIVLGVVSYHQSNQIHHETEVLYKHPLKVKRAISNLKVDVLNMRIGLRDLMLAKNETEKEAADQLMETSHADIQHEFDILYEGYLGPREDIDSVMQAYNVWNASRLENI